MGKRTLVPQLGKPLQTSMPKLKISIGMVQIRSARKKTVDVDGKGEENPCFGDTSTIFWLIRRGMKHESMDAKTWETLD